MTDKETGGAANKGWTDRERLVYLVALVEQSAPKLDFKETPRPNGRTQIACERMVQRLKDTLKDDLVALKAGHAVATEDNGTPKTPKTPKRKAKAADGEEGGSPKKRGRPAKKSAEKVEEEPETETPIKPEAMEDEGGLDDLLV